MRHTLWLRTFGGLRIEEAPKGLGGAAGQRRPLALLLLLADAGEQGASRDKLGAFLWGDSDRERSRSALRQLVYAIRRDLENTDVIVGTADLRLNLEVLPCDVVEFDAAQRAHDFERLVSVYTGPFADGFFLNGAPEFERWLLAAQQQRAQQFAEAVRKFAADAEQRGDKRAVVECWRRLAAADPLSTEASMRYVQALADVGDRMSALKHARVHEALVREEFGVPPDLAFLQLAERLRTPPHSMTALQLPAAGHVPGFALTPASSQPVISDSAPERASGFDEVIGTTQSTNGVTSLVAPVMASSRWRRGRRVAATTALAMVVVLAVAAALVLRWRGAPALNPRLVAVVPYQTFDSSLAGWRHGMADLLATTVDGREGFRAVPPSVLARDWTGHNDAVSARELGRRTGAGTVVYGFIVRAGADSVKVVTSMLNVTGNRTSILEHRASLSHTDRLVDSLTAAVLREARRLSEAAPELAGTVRR